MQKSFLLCFFVISFLFCNCSSEMDKSYVSCKEDSCSNNKCESLAINDGKYCTVAPEPEGGTPEYTFTCSAGNCIFNPINIGLCNEFFVNTGTIHGLLIADSARALNNNQEVRAVAGKFLDLDNITYKCAGYYYLPVSSGTIFSVFVDNFNTPEKEGFSPNETINLYIRTNNYVCRVKADYDTSKYPSKEKWQPLGISKIIKFKDASNAIIDYIDFSNTANCTLVDVQ